MREPAFWWREAGLLARLLAPLGAMYGAVAAIRMWRKGRRARVPVVCIGNLTLGGSGKTPAAIALARMLQAAGHSPAFLTRGYGGRLAGPVLVAPTHTAAEVGDEPLLLARIAPTIVARDRVAGAAAAEKAGADIIVMDDGFQNPSLTKDTAVLVIDGTRGIGNGKVFPAGPLRAPLAAQIAAAGRNVRFPILLIVGEPGASARAVLHAWRRLPSATGSLVPDPAAVAALAGRRVLAFAGIGDPEKFFATLRAAGVAIEETRSFADHHAFTAAEAGELVARADAARLTLVTTEKDHARMSGNATLATLAARAMTLPVVLAIDDAEGWRRGLADLLRALREQGLVRPRATRP
ncbi:MAG TPA: tetraacyldisaccharide 4'-kinase [Xanthobacteraceae bacterium]|nr:tetraacyldisaccharide 4'-kinase [Xanthobacteraceae bacterium]